MIPHDPKAELGALGAVIVAGTVGGMDLRPLLYTENALKLWAGIEALVASEQPIDAATVGRAIEDMPLAVSATEAVGPGLAYWLPVLREKAALRAIAASAHAALAKVSELNAQTRSIGPGIRATIAEASSELTRAAEIVEPVGRKDFGQCIGDVVTALENADHGIKPPTIPTGIDALDFRLAGGLPYGCTTVLAARTSVGKTALALQIARAAVKAGKRVLYVSREMSSNALTARLWSSETGVGFRICDGTRGLNPNEKRSLVVAADAMKAWPLRITTSARTAADARAEAIAFQADLVVLDHCGILSPDTVRKNASSFDNATAISNAARDMAIDLGVAVLALVQVNRAGVEEDAPGLHHLKGSGSFEEDARVVLLLHRTAEHSPELQDVELHVAKHSEGAPSRMDLRFETTVGRFSENFRT